MPHSHRHLPPPQRRFLTRSRPTSTASLCITLTHTTIDINVDLTTTPYLPTMSLRQSALTFARARPAAPFASARRFASSSASEAESSTSNGKLPMTWSEYLALRKRRRQWSTFTTIPTSIGGLFAGGAYCAQHSMTAEGATILGFDPMSVSRLCASEQC